LPPRMASREEYADGIRGAGAVLADGGC
jgi:hypothetical protein